MSSEEDPSQETAVNAARSGEQHPSPQAQPNDDEIPLTSMSDVRRIITEHPEKLKATAIGLVKLAAPATLSIFTFYASSLFISVVVGHRLGAEGLEGIAAGITAYNVCSLSLGIGMISALDTLASQAFGRDKKNPELGELVQRVTIIMALFALPCFAFFYFSGAILPLVFSNKLAQGASLFLNNCYVYLATGLLNYIIFSVLSGCRLTHIPFYGSLAGAAVVGVMSYYVVDSLPTAAWTLTAGVTANNLVMICIASQHPDTEGIRRAQWPLSSNTLKMDRIREFFAIAFPAMVACCSEWWSFEALIVIAASVGDSAVGVMTIVFNIATIFFPLPSGVQRAVMATVGNALGENKPNLAKLCALTSFFLTGCLSFCSVLVVLFFGRQLFQLWTTDEELLSLFPSVHIWVMCLVFLDDLQYTLQGGYRGVGKQDMLAKRVLISVWPVGAGCAYLFSHWLNLGIGGVIFGNVCGLAVLVPLQIHGMKGWDWEALALKASKEKKEQYMHTEDSRLSHMGEELVDGTLVTSTRSSTGTAMTERGPHESHLPENTPSPQDSFAAQWQRTHTGSSGLETSPTTTNLSVPTSSLPGHHSLFPTEILDPHAGGTHPLHIHGHDHVHEHGDTHRYSHDRDERELEAPDCAHPEPAQQS